MRTPALPPTRQALFVCSQNRWRFGAALLGKPLINLRIPDQYPFQDPALVALLRERLRVYYGADVADIR